MSIMRFRDAQRNQIEKECYFIPELMKMTGVEPHELSKLSNDLILTPQRRMEHVQGFVNEMRRKHDQNKKLGGDALGLSFQSMLDLEG